MNVVPFRLFARGDRSEEESEDYSIVRRSTGRGIRAGSEATVERAADGLRVRPNVAASS